jgi:ABC-type nickel/cobalt efflux system permease component RcnA
MAALMPLSVNRKFKAAWLGVRWGIGHTAGVLIVAIILLAIREAVASSDAVNLSFVEEWGERLVGVMLILLGLWGVRGAMRKNLHVHEHSHDGEDHAHLHVHATDAHDPADKSTWHKHLHAHAALGAGTLHGLAGMAHLLGVVPALALTLVLAFAYLAGFAVGSIASMAVFAGGFGAVTAKLGARSPIVLKGSIYVASIACVLIGIAWIVLPFTGIEFRHEH